MNYYHEFTPVFGVVDWIFIILSIFAMVVVGFRQSQWQNGHPTWVTNKSAQHKQVKWIAILLAVLFGVTLLVEHGDGLIQWYDNTAEKPDVSPASALFATVIMSIAFCVILRLVAWVAGLAKHGWYWLQRVRLYRRFRTASENYSRSWQSRPRHAKSRYYSDYYNDYYDDEMRKHRIYCQKARKQQKTYKDARKQELKGSRSPKQQQCHLRKRK